ncbi:YgaP-like transmembrane domain [Natrialba aegyptia]|uniref:Cyclase n=1 Tax=Natrialba aegyptia DSM 13077 TaxID=1227491 RepID=M0B011_9EURY|nr:YgaP-like transmembrane domain [Natrialba aegyptia]ELZ03543.1 cyclase [Natrialba aegyptia DSM 13077]
MTAQPNDASLATADEPATPSSRSESGPTGNVGRWDRLGSAALGGILLVRGLRKRSLGGAATALVGGALVSRGVRGHSHLYRRLGVNTAGNEYRDPEPRTDSATVERSITVGKPADELVSYWRDPEQLSRLVGHFADVTTWGKDRYNWRVYGPLGQTIEWDTQLVSDRPDTEQPDGDRSDATRSDDDLHWETIEDAPIPHDGTVEFRPAPGDRGTEVTLRVQYDPPGGALGTAVMRWLDVAPDVLVGTTLRRFKSLAETGEIPTLEANPSARGAGDLV